MESNTEVINAEGQLVKNRPGFSIPAGEEAPWVAEAVEKQGAVEAAEVAAETAARSGVAWGVSGAASFLNPVVDAVSLGLLAGAAGLGIASAITGNQMDENTLRDIESHPRTGFDY